MHFKTWRAIFYCLYSKGFPDASHKNKCIQNNLRFVRDADVVLNSAGTSPHLTLFAHSVLTMPSTA